MDCRRSSSFRQLVVILFLCVMTSFSQQSPKQPLASLVDRNRVLLVFAPASSEPNFANQRKFFKDRASQASDRDLILIPVLATWTSNDIDLRKENASFTTETEQISLRTRYKIQPTDFTVILIGKDGGEKLRSRTPVTMEKLSELIDTMPMRQQEMQHHKS
jgi:hypothetical protein